jgi:cyclomaltodextrinase
LIGSSAAHQAPCGERHNTFCDDFTPLTFLGNHDVTRIASKLDDQRSLGHALAVLLAVPGIPSVYYGDEQGFRGVKEDRFGGDDAVRPAFDSSKELLDPDRWSTFHLHQDLIGCAGGTRGWLPAERRCSI